MNTLNDTFDTVRIVVSSSYDENGETVILINSFESIETFDITEEEMYEIIGDFLFNGCDDENAMLYPDSYFEIKDNVATVYANPSNYLDIKESLNPFVFEIDSDIYDEDEAGDVVWECIADKDWDRLAREMDSSEAITLHVELLRSTSDDAEYYFGEDKDIVEKLFLNATDTWS